MNALVPNQNLRTQGISKKARRMHARLPIGFLLFWPMAGLAGDDVARFEQLWSFGFGPVLSVDYSPDGSHIAAGGAGTIFLINAKSYEIEQQLAGHTGIIWSVKWSPDGKYLASGSEDTTVKIWEVETSSVVIALVR